MPHCIKCGSQIAERAKFCPKCGQRVERVAGSPKKEDLCPNCGGKLRFIDQYQQWWCDNCQMYTTQMQTTPPYPQPPQSQPPYKQPSPQAITLKQPSQYEKILGSIRVTGSEFPRLLFFTNNRIIVAKAGQSFILIGVISTIILGTVFVVPLTLVVGAPLLTIIAGGIFLDSIIIGVLIKLSQSSYEKKLKGLSLGEVLKHNKENYTIPFSDIYNIRLKNNLKGFWVRNVEMSIFVPPNNYRFKIPEKEGKQKYSWCTNLLYSILGNRVYIEQGTSGCFIATAAYGTPTADEIQVLRHWRDNELRSSRFGDIFIGNYYYFSPPIARLISNSEPMKGMVRFGLKPFIRYLNMRYGKSK